MIVTIIRYAATTLLALWATGVTVTALWWRDR